MDPTLRERLAAMVTAYDTAKAAPAHEPTSGAHEPTSGRWLPYLDLLRKAPDHLGLARLVLELDAEVQRLRANEAAREGVLRRTTEQLRAHERFADDVATAMAVPERMHRNAPILLDALLMLRARLTG